MRHFYILNLFFLSFFLVSNLSAQDEKFSIGARAGLNIASMSNGGSASITTGGNNNSVKNSPILGLHLGAYSEIKINDVFSIQPELLFSMKGSRYESNQNIFGNSQNVKSSTSLSYLEIPIQMRFNFGKGFHILAGPYIGVLLGANYKSKTVQTIGNNTTTTENKSNSKDGINSADVGIYAGAGYQLENGLGFALRWCKGFSDITEATNTSRTHSVFQLSVSYKIFGM